MVLDFYIIAGVYLFTVLLAIISNLIRGRQGKHVTKAEKFIVVFIPVFNIFSFVDVFKKNK